MSHTFTTILCWQDGEEDREACAKVTYDRYAGYAGDRTDPPQDAKALGDQTFVILPAVEVDRLAGEYRAEQRADDRMMEKFG